MGFFIGHSLGGDGDMKRIVYDQDGNNVVDVTEGLMVWQSGFEYKVNNIVIYGNDIWRCSNDHVSGSSFNTGNFINLTEGIETGADSGVVYNQEEADF